MSFDNFCEQNVNKFIVASITSKDNLFVEMVFATEKRNQ